MTKEEVEEQLKAATTNANLRIDIEMEEELLPLPKGMDSLVEIFQALHIRGLSYDLLDKHNYELVFWEFCKI